MKIKKKCTEYSNSESEPKKVRICTYHDLLLSLINKAHGHQTFPNMALLFVKDSASKWKEVLFRLFCSIQTEFEMTLNKFDIDGHSIYASFFSYAVVLVQGFENNSNWCKIVKKFSCFSLTVILDSLSGIY